MNKQCKEIGKSLDQQDGPPSQGFCGQTSKGSGEKYAGTEISLLHVN